jgi:hypothetical protein
MKMRWGEHVMRHGPIRNAYKILVEKLEGRGLLEDLDVDR